MRKIIAIVLMLLLIVPVFAEEIDWASCTIEELYAVLDSVNEELLKRGISASETFTLSVGLYYVGSKEDAKQYPQVLAAIAPGAYNVIDGDIVLFKDENMNTDEIIGAVLHGEVWYANEGTFAFGDGIISPVEMLEYVS